MQWGFSLLCTVKKHQLCWPVSDDLESYVAHDFVQKEFVLFRVEQMSIRGSIVSHLLLYENNLVSSWTCLNIFLLVLNMEQVYTLSIGYLRLLLERIGKMCSRDNLCAWFYLESERISPLSNWKKCSQHGSNLTWNWIV